MKQTGNSAQAARAEMDHAQAELMEILWKKEQAAKKAGKRWTATDNKKAADALYTTQPHVSKIIKALEEYDNVKR